MEFLIKRETEHLCLRQPMHGVEMSNDSRRDGSDSVCSGEPYNQLQDSVDAVYSLLKKVLMIRKTEGSRDRAMSFAMIVLALPSRGWTGKNCYDRSVRSRAHSKLHLARDGGKTPLPLEFRSCGKHCNQHCSDRGIPKRSQVQRGGCVVRTHALLLLLSALAVPVNMTCRKAPHAVTHACPCA